MGAFVRCAWNHCRGLAEIDGSRSDWNLRREDARCAEGARTGGDTDLCGMGEDHTSPFSAVGAALPRPNGCIRQEELGNVEWKRGWVRSVLGGPRFRFEVGVALEGAGRVSPRDRSASSHARRDGRAVWPRIGESVGPHALGNRALRPEGARATTADLEATIRSPWRMSGGARSSRHAGPPVLACE